MESQVFDRVEKKYLITAQQKTRLLKLIRKHMKKDGYYRSEVSNLYFDTDTYDLIIQSIDRPEFKEKLRARSYLGYDRVFLEIKTKLRGRDHNSGYKRRILLTRKEFDEFMSTGASATDIVSRRGGTPHDAQIAREVDYLVEHFGLKPQILVVYNRESYKGEDDLRITFDENLRYRNTNLSSKKSRHDKIYFEGNTNIIMELKAHGVVPLWLVHAMSAEHIYPQQFSKIGKVYEKLITTKGKNV